MMSDHQKERRRRRLRLFARLSQLYRDPNFPGSFKGVTPFYQHLKDLQKKDKTTTLFDAQQPLTKRLVEEWKHHDEKYALFKQSRNKKTPRCPYKLFNPDNIWEGDLLDMGRYT